VLRYDLPNEEQAAHILRSRLRHVAEKGVRWKTLAREFSPMSHADLARVADEVLKALLIDDRVQCTERDIRIMLTERQRATAHF